MAHPSGLVGHVADRYEFQPTDPFSLRERVGVRVRIRMHTLAGSILEVGLRCILPVGNCLVLSLVVRFKLVRVDSHFRRPRLKPPPKRERSHWSDDGF